MTHRPGVTFVRGPLLGLALLFSSCSGAPTIVTPTPIVPPATPAAPPPEVPAAPIARLSVLVDRTLNAVAIQGASSVAFDGSNSSGSGLRYGLDYGDGQGIDGVPGASHFYASSGTFRARLVVTDSLGRTDTAAVDVVVRSIAGSWYSSFYNQNSRRNEYRALAISQSPGGAPAANALAGSYQHPEGWTTPFNGFVGTGRQVKLDLTDGTISMTGDNEFADRYGASPDLTKLALLVRGGSADGQVLTFSR